jgi:hypothetical protein
MENWTVENFMIVGQAMWKMFTFFWPVIVVGAIGMYQVHRIEEVRNESK